MSILLFLNELSCGMPEPVARADEAMEHFVDLLRYVRQQRSDAALVSSVKREHLELARGYYVNQWIGAQSRHRDLWRVIQSMQNRAPFSDVLPPGVAEGTEYTWNGHEAKGLAAAHLMDGLLVSILIDPVWDTPWIDATCEELIETVEGDLDTDLYPISARHAAKVEHAEWHDDWIKRIGRTIPRSGVEIWEARDELYPSLQFIPRVEAQLFGLRTDWVSPVVNRLRTLEEAVAEWEPKVSREPHWRSKITAEAEQRTRLYCSFADLDGVERIFDLHARFTPGAGRIHFRLVAEDRTARIAHIGLKLGIG